MDSWKDRLASPHESDENVELRRGGVARGLLVASGREERRLERGRGRRNWVDSSVVRMRRVLGGEGCGRGGGEAVVEAEAEAMAMARGGEGW